MGRAWEIKLTMGEREKGPYIYRGTRTNAIHFAYQLAISEFGPEFIGKFGTQIKRVQTFKQSSITGGRPRG